MIAMISWMFHLPALCRSFLQMGLILLAQSTLILAIPLIATRIRGLRGAKMRSLFAESALTSLVALTLLSSLLFFFSALRIISLKPVLTISLPTVRNTTIPSQNLEATAGASAASSGKVAMSVAAQRVRKQPQQNLLASAAYDRTGYGATSQSGKPVMIASTAVETRATVQNISAGAIKSIDTSNSTRAYRWSVLDGLYVVLTGIWMGGTFTLLVWLLLSYRAIRSLCRQSSVVEDAYLLTTLRELSMASGVRSPRLLVNKETRSPFLSGFRRPVILLPADYETQFDTAALNAVLAHEVTHLERRDCWWTLLARLSCAILWQHPLLWAVCRLREEAAEEICDEAALAQNCSPGVYARCLLALTERLLPLRPERTVGVGAIGSKSAIGRRIERILTTSRTPATAISRSLRHMIGCLFSVSALAPLFCIASATPSRNAQNRVQTRANSSVVVQTQPQVNGSSSIRRAQINAEIAHFAARPEKLNINIKPVQAHLAQKQVLAPYPVRIASKALLSSLLGSQDQTGSQNPAKTLQSKPDKGGSANRMAGPAVKSDQLTELKARYVAIRAKLNSAQSRYRDAAPQVKSLQRQLNEVALKIQKLIPDQVTSGLADQSFRLFDPADRVADADPNISIPKRKYGYTIEHVVLHSSPVNPEHWHINNLRVRYGVLNPQNNDEAEEVTYTISLQKNTSRQGQVRLLVIQSYFDGEGKKILQRTVSAGFETTPYSPKDDELVDKFHTFSGSMWIIQGRPIGPKPDGAYSIEYHYVMEVTSPESKTPLEWWEDMKSHVVGFTDRPIPRLVTLIAGEKTEIENVTGQLVIGALDPTSRLWLAGLRPGDIVETINGKMPTHQYDVRHQNSGLGLVKPIIPTLKSPSEIMLTLPDNAELNRPQITLMVRRGVKQTLHEIHLTTPPV